MEPGNPGCVQYVLVGEGGQLTPLGPLLQVTIALMFVYPGTLDPMGHLVILIMIAMLFFIKTKELLFSILGRWC